MKSTLVRILILSVSPALVACNRNMDGEPVDYGPPQNVQTITSSVASLVRDSDPSLTKVGAIGRYFTTIEIGGGSVDLLVANTSLEVTSSTLDGSIRTLNLLENTTEYHSNSKPSEKMKRNFQLSFRVAPALTLTPSLAPSSSASPHAPLQEQDLDQSVREILVQDGQVKKSAEESSPDITYHNLRTWEDIAPPPAKVQEHATCRGIANCRIRMRHLIFNIVSWDEPKGNLIRVELVTSPDVPQTLGFNMNPIWRYIPGLMKTCLTRLIPISDDGRNRTLVHECKTVVNFAFEKAAEQATP